jgi:hypothetical protein
VGQDTLEVISKIGFWFKIAAGPSFKPEAYLLYVEDLKRDTNNDIEPKDIFETASKAAMPPPPPTPSMICLL